MNATVSGFKLTKDCSFSILETSNINKTLYPKDHWGPHIIFRIKRHHFNAGKNEGYVSEYKMFFKLKRGTFTEGIPNSYWPPFSDFS